eukprot:TRINITY_DN87444_c0_g1_i1.p1 TRINITY_DN87444_c0_g1~~TRINITY_DN87444_c0_g1_i1.p1  ORF type:complete len:494 (-),score=82.00 TRINITY_DN87444_c0_g1_i1:23-1504(-)
MVEVSIDVHGKQDGTRRYVCGAVGVLLFICGSFYISLWRKLTPVYTATECGHQEAELDQFSVGLQTIHVGLNIQVSCSNPNPYKIDILSSTPGRVFIGSEEDRKEVGKLAVIPGSYLPEMGNGVVRVRMNADISGETSDELLPHLLADAALPIFMELKFNVGVYVSFGLGSWGVTAPFEKACGLKMMGLLVNQFQDQEDTRKQGRLGPLVCRASFTDMVLPRIGEESETPADGNMGFSAGQVAPMEVEAGETVKNLSLWSLILISFFLSAVFLYSTYVNDTQFPALPTLSSLTSSLGPTVASVPLPTSLTPTAMTPLTLKEEGEDEEIGGVGMTRPGFQDMKALGSPTRAALVQGMFSAAGGARGLQSAEEPNSPARPCRNEDARLLQPWGVQTDRQNSSQDGTPVKEREPRKRERQRRSQQDGRSTSPRPRLQSEDSFKSKSPGPSIRRSSAAYEGSGDERGGEAAAGGTGPAAAVERAPSSETERGRTATT